MLRLGRFAATLILAAAASWAGPAAAGVVGDFNDYYFSAPAPGAGGPTALTDLPGAPSGPPGGDEAKRLMQAPGSPDKIAAAPRGLNTKALGGPDTKPGSVRGYDRSHRLMR